MASSRRQPPRSLASQLLAVDDAGEITGEERAAAAEASFRAVPRALLLPLERLAPNPDNPRQSFDHLDELAASIAERGVLQPLLVRRDADRPGYYLTVAGARRLLAARVVQGYADGASRARVVNLPCVIMDETDRDAFADALAENLARQDLSRSEVMAALNRLHEEYGWSARYIAKRTGRSVGDVAELLGIARDESVASLVQEDVITPTTAGQIRRLPVELRPVAIAGVRAGTLKTGEDVRRLRQRQPAPAVPDAAPRVSDIGHPAPVPNVPSIEPPAMASKVSDIGHPAGAEEHKQGDPDIEPEIDMTSLAVVELYEKQGPRAPRAAVLQALAADLARLQREQTLRT